MKAHRFPTLTAAALLAAALPAVLTAAPPQQPGASAETPDAPIPFSEIGAKATADYQGDAIGIEATPDEARLRTGFQKLAGTVTAQGLRVESTAEGEGRLQLTAAVLRRGAGPPMPLPARGTVAATAKTVTFTRHGVTEEYSVSVDGLRQDFLVTQRPAGTGDLSLELALTGAVAEAAAYGAKLTLEGSGRVLAYSRLHVTDATGKTLTATLEVPAPDRLAIRVQDAAAYPLRIDPTFSDEDWVGLNSSIPRLGGSVYALAVSGSDLYAGGAFISAGGITVNRIVKWNGSAWSALGTGMNSTVRALVVSGSDLYAGGWFTTAGGTTVNRVAKWDGSAWSALGTGMDSTVHALAASGSNLYAGGEFTTAGGTTVNYIARWDGSAWSAFGTGMNSTVRALVASGSNVYAGGDFTMAGGASVNRIARWNGSFWMSVGTGMNNTVTALAMSGSDLYAGGYFTTAGGKTVNRIAKWSSDGWSALGSGMNNAVYALAVNGSDLYAGGEFTTAGWKTANRIAKWNGSDWSALGSGMSNIVRVLAANAGGQLFVGGHFETAGTTFTPYIAQANLIKPAPKIALFGNGQEIPNGDTVANTADHTYFGQAHQVLETVSRTFTITNTGELPLQLTDTPRVRIGGPHWTDFRVTTQPDSPVAAGESVTFTVTFDPSWAGEFPAVVSIASNAMEAPLFTFTIKGTGTGKPDMEYPSLRIVKPAGKMVSAALPLTVAGVAGDNFAVDHVMVSINSGGVVQVVQADLGASSKPSAVPFTAQISPLAGENTLTVSAFDLSRNSITVMHVFTFERRYLLTLAREVPEALTGTPDKAGTLALKATTAKNATALTKTNPATSQVLPGTPITVTAAAKTGHLFSHWTGLPEGAQVRGNVAAFVMPAADMGVTAVFVENPLTQGAMAALGAKPVFQGLLRPDETTPPGNDTAGFLSAALVPAKGSLSGKLWMDGLVTAFTGALHGDGSVWFKAGKEMAPALPFAGRELSMIWSESGLAMSVTGPGGAVSTGQARPPLHSKTTPVRGTLLDAKGRQGYFTLALPAVAQDPVKPAAEYPQGSGHAGVTLLANGTLKLAGTLAEGTKITAAAFLVEGDAAEVFVVLPTPGGKTKAGSLLGTLVFDEAQADTDVTSDDMWWFRPEAQTKPGVAQAYRAGWPGGIVVGVLGALYDGSVPVQTALGLAMTGPGGNAALIFQDGKLADEVSVPFNLEGGKVVKLDANDKTWSLKLTPKTGLMSGAFTPNWPDTAKKPPAFSGVILQKGANASGRGFFLSNAAGDTEPESGAVELGAP